MAGRRIAFLILHFSFFILHSPQAAAQGDFGAARFDTIGRNPAEYRKIIDKFALGQERLVRSECVIAYYGFPFQVYFSLEPTDVELKMQENVLKGDLEKVYDYGNMALSRNPVSLTALYWTLAAATETKKSWEVRNSLKTRYNNVTVAIAESGDGLSPETAFRIIQDGDMYIYCMVELETEISERFLVDGRYDMLGVKPSATFPHDTVFFENCHH